MLFSPGFVRNRRARAFASLSLVTSLLVHRRGHFPRHDFAPLTSRLPRRESKYRRLATPKQHYTELHASCHDSDAGGLTWGFAARGEGYRLGRAKALRRYGGPRWESDPRDVHGGRRVGRGASGWRRDAHYRRRVRLADSKDALLERMWEPKVLLRGPIAVVWAEYDFHRNKTFHHCGFDSVNLLKTAEGWKISGIAYTSETTGCKASPLGPVR
jgi:hypothetical protein